MTEAAGARKKIAGLGAEFFAGLRPIAANKVRGKGSLLPFQL
jgi:hypothetical protein